MTKKKGNRSKHQKDALLGDTSEEEYSTVNSQGKCCQHVARGIHFGRVKKSLKSSQSILTCSGCQTADKEEEEVRLCLQCGHRGCSQHSLQHFKTLHSDCHSLVLCTSSGTVWCYDCDADVSLQSSRVLRQCVEFVIKTTASGIKTTASGANPCINSTISEEPKREERPVEKQPKTVEKQPKMVEKQPKTVEKQPKETVAVKGLRNLGNTCFFNAVMQNLNQTSLLYHELKKTCDPSHPWEVPQVDKEMLQLKLPRPFTLTNSLLNFLEQMSTASSNAVINPSPLFSEIAKKCPQFRHFQQQDSHELLRQLLDGVRQEEIKRQKKAILRHFDLENVNPEEVDEETKKQIKAYGSFASHTIMEKIFGGLLISTVLCEECKTPSQVYEPFMDLSLPLFEEKHQECNEHLNAMLDGGKQDHIKPLRNRKMECEENSRPSKHQEKKQKQLAKKEKKRSRYRKNSVSEQSDNAVDSEQPEACEEENWELTALLEPEGENDSLPVSGAPVQQVIDTSSATIVVVKENENFNKVPECTLDAEDADDTTSTTSVSQENKSFSKVPESTLDSLEIGDTTFATSVAQENKNIVKVPKSMLDPQELGNSTSATSVAQENENVDKVPESILDAEEVGDATSATSVARENEAFNKVPEPTLDTQEVGDATPATSVTQKIENFDKVPESDLDVEQIGDTTSAQSASAAQNNEKFDKFPESTLDASPEDPNHLASEEPLVVNVEKASNQVDTEDVCEPSIEALVKQIKDVHIGSRPLQARPPVCPLECSVISCLSHFTRPELLTGSNRFRCDTCSELKSTGNKKEVVYSNASKHLLVFSPPAVLTLHLKRFQQVGMSLRKVNRWVEFPLVLDLAPFCSSACTTLPHMSAVADEVLYSLYGVVEHSGRLTSGHYTAYVKAKDRSEVSEAFEWSLPISHSDLHGALRPERTKTCQSDSACRWYHVSDGHVRQATETQVLKCQAYLLFYERIK